jgi:WD40 repeat protein
MLAIAANVLAQRPDIFWIGGGETSSYGGFYFLNEQYFVTRSSGWHFWRLSDNKLVRTLLSDELTGWADTASSPMPNGNQLVTAYVYTDQNSNRYLRVQIWAPADTELINWVQVASGESSGDAEGNTPPDVEPAQVNTVAVSPDGQYIAVGGGDGVFYRAGFVLYRVNGSQLQRVQYLQRTPGYAPIYAAAFSPDGEWLFGGSYGGWVFIYKRQPDGTYAYHQRLTIGGNGYFVERFAFTYRPDGKYVAIGVLPNGIIGMYRYNPNFNDWRLYMQWQTPNPSAPTSRVNDLQFTNDGNYLVAAYGSSAFGAIFYDPYLRLFQINYSSDPDYRAAIPVWETDFPSDVVTTAVLNSANTELISSTRTGDLRRWDMASREYVALPNHRGMIYSLAWSSDGAKIATAAQGNGPVPTQTFIWDIATQSVEAQISHPTASWIGALVFSPDGNYIATVGRDLSDPDGRPIELWDANTGDWVAFVGHLPYNGSGLVFSADGQYLYAADRQGHVKAFQRGTDWFTWTEIASVPTENNQLRSVQIDLSPDGSLLAVGTTNKVFLFATPNLNPVRTIEVFTGTGESIDALDWSADGRYIAVGTRDVERPSAYLISTADWSVVRQMSSSDGVGYHIFSVSLTPDGCYLLTAGSKSRLADHNLILWHTGSGTRVAAYNQETLYYINAAAFSPDGRYIAYGRDDGSLVVANNPFYRAAGDVDRNGCVDDADLLTVLFRFGNSDPDADLNCDGIVDDADLLTVLFNFGSGC